MSAPVRRARVASIALVILFLAACSAGGAASPTPVATESSVVASVPAASAAPTAEPTPAPAFPVTLTDDEGTTVEFAAQPEKIVSLTPAATEILFAIGAADRVVAKVQDIANHPPEAADLPVVATFQGVDTEQIVGLGADLVIAGGNFGTPPDAIEKLRSLGIPVLVLYAPTIDAALKDIELVGAAAGEADAAKDLAASMRAGFDQVQAATSDLPKPRVFYETGTLDTAVYGIADDSVYEELLRLAGADPVTTGSPTSWEMPTEVLITADPEIILLGDGAYGVTADAVAARPGWDVLTAVKDGAIAPVDDIVVTRPGPRLVEGLHALARAIHPDVALPSLAPVAP
jgi:iron complex transport system substrate-binding protein